ncbi:acetoacetate-CoA ligase [Lactarius vividus]|nr:acetoacetate-CoA ligase [Lactarius vividus]
MSQDLFAGSRLLSKPVTPEDTKVEVLRRFINRKHGLNLKDYSELHEYSVTDYTFWLDLWQFLGIISSVPPAKVLGEGYIKEVPRWFPGARLNYAENMLWRTDDGIAITETNETGHVASYSYRELRELVRKFATALRLHGLQSGDRVAAIIANRTTSIAIALATASLGGIFTSTATDMGVKGVLDRYRQVLPKFIFSETESIYAGKTFNLIPKVSEVVRDLSSKGLGHAILLPGIKSGQEVSQEVVSSIPLSKTLSAFLASDDGRPLTFEQLPFDHPLYILYSSGTTGPPKCIIHSGGGVLIQTKKELIAHLDVGMDDTYFQFTTTAWMMWPYMLAGLACGARMIVYEGSPFYPDVKTYLKFIDEQNVNVFGTSPRFISEVQGRSVLPRRDIGNFEALRRITTTGAVLSIPQYGWMKTAFNDRAVICAGSGGTDICGAFVSSVPSLPVYAGEMQGKTLGVAVGIFDEAGKDISETGVAGELVCTRPHPSVPIRFWGDDARGTKFLNAYYDTYPGIWHHGDFMAMNPRTKGYMILGRSDGVLNPSGVRFGSGEIYSVLERPVFSARIDDTICVGQRRPQDKDERVLLFVKMRAGHKLDPALEESISAAIRSALSRRHVPAYIFEVEELPYTVNGKKIEIAVKKIVSGMRVVPSATVANPESLESYYKYQEIEKFAQASKKGNGKDAKL